MVATDLGQATAEVYTARGRLILDTGTRPAFRRALNLQDAEPDTLAWLDALRDESCLWDIGANVGVFSLYAALSPNRRVVAFEPAAGTFALLVRNIELNRMSDRIAAYCAALSQETKLDALNMRTTEPGSWMNGFGVETNQFGEAIDIAFRQPAMGFAIDDFVRIFAPPLPSHVKMDVDGIEAMILRGGRNTLSAPTVRSMTVEIEGDPGSDAIGRYWRSWPSWGSRPSRGQLPNSAIRSSIERVERRPRRCGLRARPGSAGPGESPWPVSGRPEIRYYNSTS